MAKIAEVAVGQVWTAKVSGNTVHVKIESIDVDTIRDRKRTTLTLRSLKTGRVITRTATALRSKIINGVN